MSTTLVHQDIIQYLEAYKLQVAAGAPRFHAAFGDTPYFLDSINKRFGNKDAAMAKHGKDGAFARQSKGFMGKAWDGFESVWHYQAWIQEWGTLLLDVVYPGAVIAFFGGTRTYHRVACGLEDAGWEVFDSLHYLYGSGFPKAADIGDGYKNALKPAFEPVVLARAPRAKYTYKQLHTEFGTGGLNIEGCRIGVEERTYRGAGASPQKIVGHSKGDTGIGMLDGGGSNLLFDVTGRYPANIILDEAAGVMLDAQSGERKAGGNLSGDEPSERNQIYNADHRRHEWESYADSGGASRFFYTAKAQSWEREAGLDTFELKIVNDGRDTPIDNPYQRGDTVRKNTHPTLKPITLTEYIARLLLPPSGAGERRLLIPFAGVGSEMIGAHFAGWERVTGVELEAEYIPINEARVKWWSGFKTYEEAEKRFKGTRKAQQDADRKSNEQLSFL